MSCSCCHRVINVVARGLCNACYQRWRKNGTTDYLSKGVTHPCSIGGCDKKAVAKGLCDMHRQRLSKHGHLDQTRPDSWGAKDKHPLNHAWQWLMRYKDTHPVCDEWDDFLQFITDVGEKPSKKHKLFRADDSKPIGPNNFIWKESLIQKVEGEDEKTYNARFQRVSRKLKKEEYRGYGNKARYGITKDDYDRMLELQNGKCAICNGVETAKHHLTKEVRGMAVDHCHTSGQIRGLLCTNCNKLIGHAKDSKEVLQSAIAYLDKFNTPGV